MATRQGLVGRTPDISPNSRGPIVNVVAWIAMVTTCLSVFTVLVSKYLMLRKLTWNDLLLALAMFFSIGQTIATSEQVAAGLGKHLAALSAADYVKFQKAGYAASLLYIAALACAKLSALALLLALSPLASHRKPIIAVAGAVLIWGFCALIATTFQCDVPQAWAYETGKCFNQIALWDAVGAIDIFIDVLIMALPVLIVRHLQLSLAKKVAVVSAFSVRVFAIGATIFRLATLSPSIQRDPSHTNAFATGSSDLTMRAYLPTIAMVLATFTSIFVTCVPHLRPFMDSLQAGFLSGVIRDSTDNQTAYGSGGSYAMDRLGGSSRVDQLATMRSQRSVDVVLKNANGQILVEKPVRAKIGMNGIGTAVRADEAGRRTWRNSSANDRVESSGRHGSDAMIIKQTKEWSVTYEP